MKGRTYSFRWTPVGPFFLQLWFWIWTGCHLTGLLEVDALSCGIEDTEYPILTALMFKAACLIKDKNLRVRAGVSPTVWDAWTSVA